MYMMRNVTLWLYMCSLAGCHLMTRCHCAVKRAFMSTYMGAVVDVLLLLLIYIYHLYNMYTNTSPWFGLLGFDVSQMTHLLHE